MKESKGLITMKTEKQIDKVFDLLDDWRNLPAYQLERRADIFFAIYLPDILKDKFGVDIEYIIPEFPVRIGTIYPDIDLKNPNLSFKIDYVAVSNLKKAVYLVELKTDVGSRRDNQDKYLERSKNKNITSLVDGVLQINKATSSKRKYGYLIDLLSKIGWVDNSTYQNISQDYNIEIVYIQPMNMKIEKEEQNNSIITFGDIQASLLAFDDGLTQRFLQSLKRWEINPNE